MAVARGTLDLQRLQGEEATLSQDLSAEQGRWSELNQRLEELEQALTRR
jgi:predicted nuclease with TOPRIM domain